jgi:hypothetical protein
MTQSPLDFFDPALMPCPSWLRRKCSRILFDASLDEVSLESIEDRIHSDELTEAEGLDLWARLEQHRKQLDEYYAPSQKMISKHIRMICGL